MIGLLNLEPEIRSRVRILCAMSAVRTYSSSICSVQDFAAVDEKCPMYVREGFSMIEELAGKGDSGGCQEGLHHDRGVGREGRQW